MSIESNWKAAKAWDDSRPGFPGEHWIVLGAGLLLLAAAGRSRSFLMRTAGVALGTALVGRAASGRDGVIGLIGTIVKR